MAKCDRSRVVNFNIGMLGHVDSGKTSLAKALSTVPSTASFDKNPQSKERGITLDLGFSSFIIGLPEKLSSGSGYEKVQITLVDCPGHASLIRTIIGGAQIIDLMMLVIDATKGIQTQTAECLVVGEITCKRLIVALNKIDMFEEERRVSQVSKVTKRIGKALQATKFSGAPIVPVAANPGGLEASKHDNSLGMEQLIEVISDHMFIPERSSSGPLIFSVDHCFPIRGQGTVMTGTVLSGSMQVNDVVEIPFLKVSKKVKSMQMFHQPVQKAIQGDRVGICVTQFDAKQVERCLVSSPGHLPTVYAGIFAIQKVQYHKIPCLTGGKVHVTIGHETVMGRTSFFSSPLEVGSVDFTREYCFQKELLGAESTSVKKPPSEEKDAVSTDGQDSVAEKSESLQPLTQFALIEFERPVICPRDSLIIASRLDADAFSNICRIAFHGKMVLHIPDKDYSSTVLPQLKVFKVKTREGIVDRVQDEMTIIGKDLFKKETNIQLFVGLKVQLSTGEQGIIEGAFGTSGKFRVTIHGGLLPSTMTTVEKHTRKKRAKQGSDTQDLTPSKADGEQQSVIKIHLTFKRYVFDPAKKMRQ